MIRKSGIQRRSIAFFALAAVVLAACGDGGSGTESDGGVQPAADGEIGPPEQAELTIALPYEDGGLFQRYFVAEAEGILEDEGISIEAVTADDTRAAVVSGSVDIGMEGAGSTIQAIDQGLDIEILAGHACRQQYSFATAPGVNDVSDLDGRNVILADQAGDPARFERLQVLEEEGWDLDQVDVEEVVAGSGVAVESFLAGQADLIYYFSEDIPRLEEYGANFPVTVLRPWPNDVYFVRAGWVEENPNTAAHFLRAVIRTLEFITAPEVGESPANLDQVLEYWRQNGYEGEAEDVAQTPGPYGLGTEEMCPNLYYDEDAWETTIDVSELDVSASFDEGANIDALLRAQESLGLDNSPPEEIPWPPEAA